MYCPRCGSPNTETTKFCRQCGLALLEVTTYVSTGGTSALTPPSNQVTQIAASFTPKQKMILAILFFIFLPGIAAVISDALGLADAIVPVFGILMPIGITASVMYFRNQTRLLEQARKAQTMPPPYAANTFAPPPVQAYLQAPPLPVSAVPVYTPPSATPLLAPNTNPLGKAPNSVIEDETKRLSN